ncbi:MAG: RNA 3'-phosphate cyclase [Promethearchaeota archaeon]|nr:MAG: RNA 3'-phosphate cyclase [Candidatus Lokiarchaeota archaeon]
MDTREILKIDGSMGEGGGAILRLAMGFSILYNIPIHVKRIRANRPTTGLRMQHLLGLRLLAELTGSRLSKCEVGSTEIKFSPNKAIKNRSVKIKIPTAASIGLLLQPIHIACLGLKENKPINIFLDGGATFGKWAPSLNYLEHVTYPLYKKSGVAVEINTLRQGFYPKGGAQVHCHIRFPTDELKPLNLTHLGEIKSISGEIIITNQLKSKRNIPQRIRDSIKSELQGKYALHLKEKWVDSFSAGVGVCLWAISKSNAKISSGTLLGEPRLSSERLGKMAAERIMAYISNDIPVDNYLSDQLIPLIANVEKPSTIKVLEVTNHTKTNLELVKRFSERQYKIKKVENAFFIDFC